MDSPTNDHAYTGDLGDLGTYTADKPKPRQLPPDLPTSLDDRREVHLAAETEMYDAWQGERAQLEDTWSSSLILADRTISVPRKSNARPTAQLQPLAR
jgi:hypothetical protein